MRVFGAALLLTAATAKKISARRTTPQDLIDLASTFNDSRTKWEPSDFLAGSEISPEYEHPQKHYCCGDCEEEEEEPVHHYKPYYPRTSPKVFKDIGSRYKPGRRWRRSDF